MVRSQTPGNSGLIWQRKEVLLGEPQFKEDVPSWSFSIPFLATRNNVISVELRELKENLCF